MLAYSNASFLDGVEKSLLLPEDRKHLAKIGPIQAIEWDFVMNYQVVMQLVSYQFLIELF